MVEKRKIPNFQTVKNKREILLYNFDRFPVEKSIKWKNFRFVDSYVPHGQQGDLDPCLRASTRTNTNNARAVKLSFLWEYINEQHSTEGGHECRVKPQTSLFLNIIELRVFFFTSF